jgi:acetyl esterase/lipase
MNTHVYKRVGSLELKADVHGAGAGPALLWIHGGGLIFGDRHRPRPAFTAALNAAGVSLVSIDHRLAPETQLPDIVDDVLDAWRWLHDEAPRLWGADPRRLAIGDASAGGYLALTAGWRATPRPCAVVSFWGYGDITAAWEAAPSEYYNEARYPLIDRAAAQAYVGTAPIAEGNGEPDRSAFYLYCRQTGRWPQEVAGHDPATEPAWFEPWCPVRHISATYPPTLLLHGSQDKDVPCAESRQLAVALAAAGVQHRLIEVPGAGHGLAGIDAAQVAALEQDAAAFVVARLLG